MIPWVRFASGLSPLDLAALKVYVVSAMEATRVSGSSASASIRGADKASMALLLRKTAVGFGGVGRQPESAVPCGIREPCP